MRTFFPRARSSIACLLHPNLPTGGGDGASGAPDPAASRGFPGFPGGPQSMALGGSWAQQAQEQIGQA
eukprot:7812738-Pyramimonas_sp.AAC.1